MTTLYYFPRQSKVKIITKSFGILLAQSLSASTTMPGLPTKQYWANALGL